MRKRNRLRIFYDILKVIHDRNNNILHTHILYKANLSYPLLKQYLAELSFNNLIRINHFKAKKTYSLTDKGFDFINRYQLVDGFLDVFGLQEKVSQ